MARICEEPQIQEYNTKNPANKISAEEHDYTADDRQERSEIIRQRLKTSQLNPSKTGRLSNTQQAFNIFSIPVVLDTKLLTAAELKKELKTRGLRLDGNKEQLQRRLDKYITENEKDRVKEHTGRASDELGGTPTRWSRRKSS